VTRSATEGAAGGQASAPYLEALAAFVARGPTRFLVPGHKGGAGADAELLATLGANAFACDVPQDIHGIDVGPSPTPYEQAERLAAEAYGAARSWFLTNGATQGNHALCLALARERDVIVQRNSHASIVDGLVLSGGRPHFALPDYEAELAMALCVTPDALADALRDAPAVRAAFIVSPTYYGASASIAECAEVCHAAGAALIVDQAWGPHFGFHDDVPRSALALGADAVLTSTHKIVGSLTQSAMLHVAETEFVDVRTLARAVRLMRSTSPSSLLLASLDAARRQLAVRGAELLERTLASAAVAREAIEEVPGCRVVPAADRSWPSVTAWDPLRLVIDVRESGADGHHVAAELRDRFDVQIELATHATIVLVLGINEPPGPLEEFPERLAACVGPADPAVAIEQPALPLRGEPALSPRAAWVATPERVAVEQAIGRVSAEAIAGYPPGIPVLLPGERVTEAVVAYLRELVRAGVRLHGASDPLFNTVTVVAERCE
jgi:lysine decarboxylase